MAPELIQGKCYDAKADIWSFGITAIELTQGRPPRSRESAHTVLLQTCVTLPFDPPVIVIRSYFLSSVQGKPPTLDREGGVHHYSRAFKEIVDACLAKHPSKRQVVLVLFCLSSVPSHTCSPTAAELLRTPFFKNAKKKSYLVGTVLDGLPPLTMRQERRHHPESLTTQRTTESWDFGSTITSSQTPFLIGPSSRIAQKTKTLSIASKRNHGDDPETLGRLSEDNSAELPRQATVEPNATT